MPITSLGYIGVRSDRLEDWSAFATGLLGMQQVEKAGKTTAYRMDDRKQRLVISNEPGDTLAFLGWEVSAASDLDTFSARLDSADVAVMAGDRSLCDRRCVNNLVYFNDPDGNRLELFHGPETCSNLFTPGRAMSGFNTGPYGMGHAVLHVKDANSLLPFYQDLLGFSLTDYGLKPYPLYFFHVNGRHHSFAMVGSGKTGFHHFMVEFCNLDDVGQGYDLALLEPERIAYTLGRHTNDYMTSYYANTPSGFFVESGWGGRVIKPETWEPHETHDGPSFWGHDRLYLDEEPRARMRDMRLQAAAEGKRTPPIVDCPWLYQMKTRL